MFEKMFGKKRTEKPIIVGDVSAKELVNEILEKVSKSIELDIKNYVKELKKNGNSQKEALERLEKDKKELEVKVLERDMQNKAEHHTVNRTNNTEWYKHRWYRCTSFFRLKIDGHDIKNILLNHKEAASPQALQGKWQAYGQMRAARTITRSSIFATSVVSAVTAIFVSNQSSKTIKLNEREKILLKREETIKDSADYTAEFTLTTEILKKQLLVADSKMKELCKGG